VGKAKGLVFARALFFVRFTSAAPRLGFSMSFVAFQRFALGSSMCARSKLILFRRFFDVS
jgi:hypothetical protein